MSQTVPAEIRILLIEDQDSEALFVRRMLVRPLHQEFTMEHVPTLAEGVQLLSVRDFDVCILDLGLPDGSGIDSLHQIRSVDARVPVVVLTGSDDEQLGLAAIESGAQDFIAKDAITGQLLSRSLRFAIARQQKMLGHAADANTDTLTGIPNRRKLAESFAELTATGNSASFALLDIDHFKAINDTYGHLIGDEVIRQTASIIAGSAGKQVQAARYGGEEFAILFAETEVYQAKAMVEHLLNVIQTTKFEVQPGLTVTASAGVSQVAPSESLEDSIRRTDIALYAAKHSGRNRVCAAKE